MSCLFQMASLVLPLPRLGSRLRAPVRQFAFWSEPAGPPFTDFPLVTPLPSGVHYGPSIVPSHIVRPQYADTGQVDIANIPRSPVIWTDREIDKVWLVLTRTGA